MNTKTEQTTEAAIAAQTLKARALATGAISVLAFGISTDHLATLLGDLAEEYEGGIPEASAALWSMDEVERLEALGLDEDDPKSYYAALYAVAA